MIIINIQAQAQVIGKGTNTAKWGTTITKEKRKAAVIPIVFSAVNTQVS